MSDPIESVINRSAFACYLIGIFTGAFVLSLDLSWVGAAIVGGLSAIPIWLVEYLARRKIYGHVYHAIRMSRGWV